MRWNHWITVASAAALALVGGMVLQAKAAGAAGLGCHVMLGAGASSSNMATKLTHTPTNMDVASINGLAASGGALGIGAGCDLVVDRILIGADVEQIWHNASWNASIPGFGPGGFGVAIDLDKQVFLTGRAGVVLNDNALIYMRAGMTKLSTGGLTGTFGADFGDFTGKVLGGGAEFAIGKHVKLAIDYKHSWFDAKTAPLSAAAVFGPVNTSATLKPEQDLVMLQLIYNIDFFGSVLGAQTAAK